jgi:hypothetical protein
MDMSMKMNASGQGKSVPVSMDTTSVFEQSVKSVAPDGTGTVALTLEKLSAQVNGKSRTENANSSNILKITPSGQSTVVSSSGSNQGGSLSNMQLMSNFPTAPIKVGSSWSSNFNMPGANLGGPGAFKLTNKVDKIEHSGGKVFAYIHSFGKLDMGQAIQNSQKMPSGSKATGGMTADLHYVFNISQGLVQSMDGTASFTMNFTGMGAQSGTTNGGMRMAFRLLN